MNNQIKTPVESRKYINNALSSGRFNQAFVETTQILAESSNNLDKVIADIDNYQSSRVGINLSYKDYSLDQIAHYKSPIFITLTSRYEIPIEEIKYRYIGLIKHVSKKAYKNAYRRKGKTFSNVGYVEIAAAGNTAPHIHCVFDMPDFLTNTEFRKLISDYWGKKTGFIDYKEITEEDKNFVSAYITKARTKQDFITLQESFVTF